jgi:hypothetical protein
MTFRDRFLTPKVAHAVTSPSAIVATGAGAAVAILVGLGPIGAVVLGAAAWGARVLAAVPRDPAKADPVNPHRLSEPWRGSVEAVQRATRRFDDAVATVEPGPLRDRLTSVGERLATAEKEAWRIAQAGQVLTGGRKRIDTTRITSELQFTQNSPQTAHSAETVEAFRAQLAAAARLDATIADTRDRLRLLEARTDEAVTSAVELSVSQADPDDVTALDDDVSHIVGDLEALRLAIEETDGAAGGPGPATASDQAVASDAVLPPPTGQPGGTAAPEPPTGGQQAGGAAG